jgi:hypothetical protein
VVASEYLHLAITGLAAVAGYLAMRSVSRLDHAQDQFAAEIMECRERLATLEERTKDL